MSSGSPPGVSSYAGRNISNTFWSYSTLSRRDGPMLTSWDIAAVQETQHLLAQDLSNSAWSCAQLAFANKPLLHAISSSARARIAHCVAQDLANMAWSFAYFIFTDVPLLQALSTSARRRVGGFISQNLATTSWALEELGCDRDPVVRAISMPALWGIDSFDPMPMATLLDRRLSSECHAELERRFYPIADRFYSALRPSVDFWRDGSYQRLVLDFRIGNFGCVGGRRLYSKLGIYVPGEDFLHRARECIPRVGRMMGDTYNSDGAEFLRQRVSDLRRVRIHISKFASVAAWRGLP